MIKNILSGFIILLLMRIFVEAQTNHLNQKIVDYVTSQVGKKVDRGECWDLAYQALTQNNCEWDGRYVFGKKINPKTDSIYAGDILQFEGVTVKYQENNMTCKESFPHHTAIIYQVIGKGDYKIAHQNFGNNGRKVGITRLRLADKVTGTITFYRPVLKTE